MNPSHFLFYKRQPEKCGFKDWPLQQNEDKIERNFLAAIGEHSRYKSFTYNFGKKFNIL